MARTGDVRAATARDPLSSVASPAAQAGSFALRHFVSAVIVAALSACPVWALATGTAPTTLELKVDAGDPVRASFARMLAHEPTHHRVAAPVQPRDPLVDAMLRPRQGTEPGALAASGPDVGAGSPGRDVRQR